MPIPSIPSLMPNVLGYAADLVPIPESTPNGQGVPSFRDVFPFITQVAPDAGGLMIERAWMNSLFNLLGQHAFFTQSGGVYPWVGDVTANTGLDYVMGCHVLGSDNVEYVAVKASGPDVPDVGVKNPIDPANQYHIADNPDGYWWVARPGEMDVAIARKAAGLDPGQVGIVQPGAHLGISEAGILTVDASVDATASTIPLSGTDGTLVVDWLPKASISKVGVVQLNDSITSTSITEAATANAVRMAHEASAGASFPTGTRLAFQQSAAPLGWVKMTDTFLNGACPRMVTGNVSMGGSNAFNTAFNSTRSVSGNVGATTLSESQMPSHRHSITTFSDISFNGPSAAGSSGHYTNYTNYAGSTASHTHSLSGASFNLNVKYVDFIVCQKS